MTAAGPHPEGAVLPVRAHAGARRSEIRQGEDGVLRVSVTQAPEKGKANKAIVVLLAKELGLKKSQIELIAGETSPQKRFLVRGLSPQELRQRIEDRAETAAGTGERGKGKRGKSEESGVS